MNLQKSQPVEPSPKTSGIDDLSPLRLPNRLLVGALARVVSETDFQVRLPPGFTRADIITMTKKEERTNVVNFNPMRLKKDGGSGDPLRGIWEHVLGSTLYIFRYPEIRPIRDLYRDVARRIIAEPFKILDLEKFPGETANTNSKWNTPEGFFIFNIRHEGKEQKDHTIWNATFLQDRKRFIVSLRHENVQSRENSMASHMAQYLTHRFRIVKPETVSA